MALRALCPALVRRVAAACAALVTAAALAACGTPDATVSFQSAQQACAPLAEIRATALKVMDPIPVGTSPVSLRDPAKDPIIASQATADAVAALAPKLLPVADALDAVASKAGVQAGDEQQLVTGILGAEIALRRISVSLKAHAFAEASLASDDFAKEAKLAGLECPTPLGEGTLRKLQALPTPPPSTPPDTTPAVPTTPIIQP